MLLVWDHALRITDFGEQMQAKYVNTDAWKKRDWWRGSEHPPRSTFNFLVK